MARTLQTSIPSEYTCKNRRPKKKKIINRIVAEQIQQCIKRSIHKEQMKFIPGLVSLISGNQCNTPY